MEAGEECDDGNTSSGDGCAADCRLEPSAVLDHFLGYKVKESRGNICAAGAPREGARCESEQDCGGDDTTSFCVKNHFTGKQILLKDQFEENLFAVQKLVRLYNPANKNDEGIINASIHFIGYQLTEAKVCSDTKTPCTARRECNLGAVCKPHKHEPRDNIRVDNQFGALVVDTIAPDRLLVPTTKSHDGSVAAPDPSSHEVDHFKCYTVKPSKGAPGLPKGIHVSVVDQFNQPTLYDVQKPSRLCNPVDKNGEGIKRPENHLMCYLVKPVEKTCAAEAPEHAGQSCKKEEDCGGTTRGTSFCRRQEKHDPVPGLYTNNQFGPALVDTIVQEELCVPSVKTEP